MFVDTHCHLNLDEFTNDYKQTVERAYLANVKKIIIVGSDLASSKKAVEIAKEYENNVYAAVGLHPTDAATEVFDEKKISELLYSKRVVAIGEIGLDFHGENIDKQTQLELLNKQIDLAIYTDKPIIIHCRDAYSDLISALKSFSNLPKGVVHCYVGTWADAQTFLAMGFYLSFTGIITFGKNSELEKVVQNTPLDRILIETDSPWLAPVPYRGKRNEPAYAVEVAKKIAEIKKIPLAEVETQTTKNAEILFNI